MVDIEIGQGKNARRGYGFDEIAIVPSRRTRDPDDVDISWEIDAYHFELPLAASAMDAAKGADALVIMTEWKAFRSPDFDGLIEILRQPVIFDGRNLYEPAVVAGHGFEYHAIGRGNHVPALAGAGAPRAKVRT